MKIRISIAVRSFFVFAVLGCSEGTAPVRTLTLNDSPRFLVFPPSATGVTPAITSPVDPSFTITLPTFAEQVIVQFQVDGVIDIPTADPFYKPPHQADGSGFYRSDGFEGCYVNIKFTYTLGSWGPGPCSASPFHSLWVDTALIQGSGTLKRGGKIPQWDWECGGNPCWFYSGTQTYSITPLTATIDLTTPGTSQPTPGYIDRPPAGTWALFRVAGSPSTLKNINVPIRVLSWQWTAAAGGAGQTVLTGGATAIQRSAYITETGRMVVAAVVNGREQIDTVRVGIGPDSTVQCAAEAQTMAAEYEDTVYHNTLRPNCLEFRNSGGSAHFSWPELNDGWAQGNPHTSWSLIKTSLTDGLEATRTSYNRGPILLSSGYRCPHGNKNVNGVTNSFHTHGRAADMYSAWYGGRNWSPEECALLRDAASQTNTLPDELLPCNRYTDRHLHAAW